MATIIYKYYDLTSDEYVTKTSEFETIERDFEGINDFTVLLTDGTSVALYQDEITKISK